jgi:hypothetical protein
MLEPAKVTDELRARVRAELPEVERIRDAELAAKVVEAWALALASSSFRAIAEIEPSGNPGVNTLRRGRQTDHIRGVTRMALALAEALQAQLPDRGRPGHPDRRRALPRRRQALGVRSREPQTLGGRAARRRPALGPPSGVRRPRLLHGRPAGGGRALRRRPFGRGRAPDPLAREHDRASRRLCLLGHLPRGRPPASRDDRRAQGPTLSRGARGRVNSIDTRAGSAGASRGPRDRRADPRGSLCDR